ncbi:MAG TPA: ATP-binding protein [Nitrospira sp.]|nr:ATP-binding protein [Nitrospira sp.]
MPDPVSVLETIALQIRELAGDGTVDWKAGSGGGRGGMMDLLCQVANRAEAAAHDLLGSLHLLREVRFAFRTPEEASQLTTFLAAMCPDSARAAVGIGELLLNAVEHGNLEIGYEEKTRLVLANQLEREVARRLLLPKYAARYAAVRVERMPNEVILTITDQGPGFDWRPYLEFGPERMLDSHGRGIATALLTSFSRLEYRQNGSEVTAVVRLPQAGAAASEMPKAAATGR